MTEPTAMVYITGSPERGHMAGRLIALAKELDYPVDSIKSRPLGYEVPVEVAKALAEKDADAEKPTKSENKDETPVKRGPGRPKGSAAHKATEAKPEADEKTTENDGDE